MSNQDATLNILTPLATAHSNSSVLQLEDLPPLTAMITKQQIKLFGHILRAESTSLEKHVCFTASCKYRAVKTAHKRVGGPKEHWIEQAAHILYLNLTFPPQAPCSLPYFYSQLRGLAADRPQWQQCSSLPTSFREQVKHRLYRSHQKSPMLTALQKNNNNDNNNNSDNSSQQKKTKQQQQQQ